MKPRLWVLGLVWLSLLLSAFTGDALQKEASTATLIFYQRGSFANGNFKLIINDQIVADPFLARTYLEVTVPVGNLTIRTASDRFGEESKRFAFTTAPGKTYYIEAIMDYDFMIRSLYLVQREEQEALTRIKKLKRDEKALQKVD